MNESAGTARRLAKDGYGVYGIDYEGHGKSDGLPALVTDFNLIVHDCAQYFASVSVNLSLHITSCMRDLFIKISLHFLSI